MSADVIIVNFRTPDLTAQAVESVLREKETATVFVVDNASGDSSVYELKERFAGKPVKVIESVENLGFGGGNNLAVQEASAPYLFFINSDAFVQPGCIRKLIDILESDKAVGIVAPAIYLEDQTTLQADALGAFPTPQGLMTRKEGQTDPLFPDWVSGVAFLVRREEFVAMGMFDEQFFMYLEDVELCHRYRREGLAVKRQPESGVVHLGGRSRQSSLRQKEMYFRSQDYYLKVVGFPFASRLAVRVARIPYYWFGRLFLWK